jgi:integrase
MGRKEIVRALGTQNPQAARVVAAGLAHRIGRLWAIMRTKPDLTKAKLQELADAWLSHEVEREWGLYESCDFARALLAVDASVEDARRENAYHFNSDASYTAEKLIETDPALRSAIMDSTAGEILAREGYGARRGTRERAELSLMLLAGRIDLQAAKMAWASGDPSYLPPQLTQRSGASAVPEGVGTEGGVGAGSVEPSRTLGEAIEVFLANMRQKNSKRSHIKDAIGDFRFLTEAFGADRRVRSTTPSDAGRLWEALRALPPGFRKLPALSGLSLFDQAQRARELGLSSMHHRTANSYLARFRKLFEQEIAAEQASINPFSGKRVDPEGRVTKQERTFTPEELEKIFSNPLFQGAKSDQRRYAPGSHLVADWMFWAPLIAALSGARIGEIAQLRPSDIRQAGSYMVIDFNEENGKSLKNEGTARQIPVHSRLVELGLLRLAEKQALEGRALLLPGMPKPVNDDPGSQPGKWMRERFLTRIGVKNRKGLGFHSFRHSLKTILRDAQVPDSINNEICGHDERPPGVAAAYGLATLDAMATALEKAKLPEALRTIRPR